MEGPSPTEGLLALLSAPAVSLATFSGVADWEAAALWSGTKIDLFERFAVSEFDAGDLDTSIFTRFSCESNLSMPQCIPRFIRSFFIAGADASFSFDL